MIFFCCCYDQNFFIIFVVSRGYNCVACELANHDLRLMMQSNAEVSASKSTTSLVHPPQEFMSMHSAFALANLRCQNTLQNNTFASSIGNRIDSNSSEQPEIWISARWRTREMRAEFLSGKVQGDALHRCSFIAQLSKHPEPHKWKRINA